MGKMNRRDFMRLAVGGTAFAAMDGFSNSPLLGKDCKDRPDILFIMSDDHAAPAISSYGGFLADVAKTPNIDRLAKEGMRFNNCFCTNSICTPSRAVILTGKYSHKNGVLTLDDDFDGKQQTFPKLLQRAGYYTAVVGKWHLKTEPTGFDYYNVLPGQGLYFNPLLKKKGNPWEDGEEGGVVYKGYVTDVITDLALDFLRNRAKDKPFCLLYQHKAPHDMWEYDKKHAHLYEDVDIPEPANLFDDYQNRGKAIKRTTQKIGMEETVFLHETQGAQFDNVSEEIETLPPKEQKKKAYQYFIKAFLRCVASIDDNIGRVLDYLDKSGLAENTIVIYTADQGFFLGEHGLFDKRFMYEESLRMPFLVRYPKEIKPGSINNDIITNVDFAETFLDYAGVPIPSDMQGHSLRPLFKGRTPNNWRKSMYYRYWMHLAHFDVAAHFGIRTNRYKLIYYYGKPMGATGAVDEHTAPEWELFDLSKDPREMNNVYNDSAYADVVKKLKNELIRLRKELGDNNRVVIN
ncbi:MAG: sulfatase family protein [Planctomycetota bacterium]|jgi:arylsulfatase A-like enzyme